MSRKAASLIGKRFGCLTVTSRGCDSSRGPFWACTCDCGVNREVRGDSLRSGKTKSCGCQRPARSRETLCKLYDSNKPKPVLLATWRGMRQRCFDLNAKDYPQYGGRGIKVCDRWLHGESGKTGLECFVEDMGPKPSPAHTVDRYPDNDGPYAPWNCRWATMAEQNLNKRSNGVRAPITEERAA